MCLDLPSLLTQATQEVSSFLMEDQFISSSEYLLLEVPEEEVLELRDLEEQVVSTLISTLEAEEVLEDKECQDTEVVVYIPEAQELEEPVVSTSISTLEVEEVLEDRDMEAQDTEDQEPKDLEEPVVSISTSILEVLEAVDHQDQEQDLCSTES